MCVHYVKQEFTIIISLLYMNVCRAIIYRAKIQSYSNRNTLPAAPTNVKIRKYISSVLVSTKVKDSTHSTHILHRSSNRDQRRNFKQLLIYVRVCVLVFNVQQCMYIVQLCTGLLKPNALY